MSCYIRVHLKFDDKQNSYGLFESQSAPTKPNKNTRYAAYM